MKTQKLDNGTLRVTIPVSFVTQSGRKRIHSENYEHLQNCHSTLVANIARGFYKDHTIVVVGYSIWRVGDKLYPMLRVIDGWKSGYHYIDYEAFAKDISQSIFGSFNTIHVNEGKR